MRTAFVTTGAEPGLGGMPDISFNGLLAVALIAVTAPLLVSLAPALAPPVFSP